MRNNILLSLILLHTTIMQAQEILNPNFAVASHPTVVESISLTSNYMLIKLTIENKIIGGNFRIDKDIFIQDVLTNAKHMLSYSEGIPVCPDAYDFKWVGEKLSFLLYFPRPSESTKYINIILNSNFTDKKFILDQLKDKRLY